MYQCNSVKFDLTENLKSNKTRACDFNVQNTTFQAVLVSDGTKSYVIYNYELLTWSQSPESEGVAQVKHS